MSVPKNKRLLCYCCRRFVTKLYSHVHVRKAIEGIGFLLSPLRALVSVAKRTRTHQKTQFALGDFHSFFSPPLIRIDERRSEVEVLIGCIHSKANQKFRSDNQTLFFRFKQGNRWRHENLWHKEEMRVGRGFISLWAPVSGSWGVGRGGCDDEGYQQNKRRRHSIQWNLSILIHCFISKITKNVSSNFKNTKWKMEFSELNKC